MVSAQPRQLTRRRRARAPAGEPDPVATRDPVPERRAAHRAAMVEEGGGGAPGVEGAADAGVAQAAVRVDQLVVLGIGVRD